MDNNKLEVSSETFQANSSVKFYNTMNESLLSLKDFNNIETAERKLTINNKQSYWVHDEIISNSSDYILDILIQVDSDNNNNNHNKHKNKASNFAEDISIVNINIPIIESEDYTTTLFFDILLWIYSKDIRRLKKYTKKFSHFTRILTLAAFLKMKNRFFESLLSKIEFSWSIIDNYNDSFWSCSCFNFEILERVVSIMNTDKYYKIIALMSWIHNVKIDKAEKADNKNIKIKELTQDKTKKQSIEKSHNTSLSKILINSNTSNNISNVENSNRKTKTKFNITKDNNNNTLTINHSVLINNTSLNSSVISMKENIINTLSKSNFQGILNNPDKVYSSNCYLVRSYMISKELTEKLSFEKLKYIYNNYKKHLLAFNAKPVINEFLFNLNQVLFCLCCEKEFISPLSVLEDKDCKGKSYHPRINLKVHSEKGNFECGHEGCVIKINKSDVYPCCHKIINSENKNKGCLSGNGRHIFILKEN